MNKLISHIQLISLCILSGSLTGHEPEEKPFDIIIPSYNNKNWYEQNLSSIFTQKYSNFRVIYVDDCSTDGTADLAEAYAKSTGFQDKLTIVRNKKNIRALANIYKSIINMCPDDHIILIIDGDDWLTNDHVLSTINEAYRDPNIWLTYGSYIDVAENQLCCGAPCHAITANDINTRSRNMAAISADDMNQNSGNIAVFRAGWMPGHPRTFFAWLFKCIMLKDLFSQGLVALSAYDISIGWPLFEMAQNHFRFIPQILYGHNVNTPLSDDKVNHYLQKCVMYDMEAKKSYKPLDTQPEKKLTTPQVSLFMFATENAVQQEKILQSISTFTPEIKSVYFIKDEKMLLKQNQTNCKKEELSLSEINYEIANSPNNYILFGIGDIYFDKSVELAKKVQLLETTKAYNYSLLRYTNKSDVLSHMSLRYTPLDSCNAYQLNYGSGILANPLDTAMTLYRKKDALVLLTNAQTTNATLLLQSLECGSTNLSYEVGLF